jgi:hypothetical protein
MRILLVAIGALVAILVLGSVAVDEGEIVTLATVDAGGRHYETQLWIVDLEGRSYLRSATPRTGWLKRLRGNPEATLTRDGTSIAVHAREVADPDLGVAVSRAMAAKYGDTDRFYSWLFDRRRSVVVLLSPLPAAETSASRESAAPPPP